MDKPRILFVDDDELLHQSTQLTLAQTYGSDLNFEPEFHQHPQNALNSIRKNPFNVCAIFLDEQIGPREKNVSGSSYIPEIRKVNSYIKVIMVSGDQSGDSLQKWILAGADNYLYKAEDGQDKKVSIFINDAIARFQSKFGALLGMRAENKFVVPDSLKRLGMISTSTEMEAMADIVVKVATTAIEPIALILGESGTGKELVAHAIHNLSKRAKNEFRVVDCTQFKNSDIVGSELFGSEKGAFTGAESKPGLFEIANGGTVFMDEVHHLDSKGQGMILRFLEDQMVRRVGGKKETLVDVRLIFAAQPKFKQMVEQGQFLPDLAFRMRQGVIEIPRLKERGNDIEILAHHFLDKTNSVTGLYQKLHPDTIDLLKHYDWPGNVRELEHAIERVCVLVQEPVLLPEHFRKHAQIETDSAGTFVPGAITIPMLRERQRDDLVALILKTYDACDMNVAETANRLNVARSTFRELCKNLNLSDVMQIDTKRQAQSDEDFRKRFARQMQLVMAAKGAAYK